MYIQKSALYLDVPLLLRNEDKTSKNDKIGVENKKYFCNNYYSLTPFTKIVIIVKDKVEY